MKKLTQKLAVIGAPLMLAAGSAFAALPTDVTTALTDAKTDGVNAAGIVLGVIIAIVSFKYIRKAL